MIRNRLALILAAGCGFCAAHADEAVDGLDGGRKVAGSAWQFATLKAPEIMAKRVALPDTLTPAVADAADAPENAVAVDKVGYVAALEGSAGGAWTWVARADGTNAARSRFTSAGACGLRLRFENIDPRAEIQIRLADEDGAQVYGPFVSPALDEDGGWWSPTVWDDAVDVELFTDEPLNEAAAPRVAAVAYMYAGGGCNTAPGSTVNCHNDISCHASWQNNEGRAVALFYNVKDGICLRWSGSLLNRGPSDFSPLFATTNLAVGTAGEASSVEVYWEYETASCNGSVPSNPANQPRNLGAIRVKREVDSDWSLIGLLDPPAASAPFYLGWVSADWSSNETATTIHHPWGSHKRISFGESGVTGTQFLCLFIPPFPCFNVEQRRVVQDDGPTEIGSTGGPVMDVNRRVRMVISGRESDDVDCADNTWINYGGRFNRAYDNLRFALADSDIASPVYVDDGVAGDPGNNGDTETGTFGAPFDTLHEATFIVRAGDTIGVSPGNYNEQFRVWRPMRIVRQGASGTVRIGD